MNLSRRKYFMIIVAIVGVFVYLFISLWLKEYSVTESYVNELKMDVEKLMSVSIGNKKGVTNMVYKKFMSENISYLLAESLVGDEEVKDVNRQILYEALKADYELLKEIGIVQFQFHLNNNESFLRFHQPERYGDDLSDIRYSVKKVNETGKRVVGYEEGRFLGGYRYVMPVLYEDQLVGSVELSYDMNSVLRPIELTYGVTTLMIMSSEEINEKAFDEARETYTLDPHSNFGYLSPEMLEKNIVDELGTTEDKLKALNEKLYKKLIISDISEGIIEYYEVEEELYWAIMEPLVDVTGETIGFIVFYKNDPALFDMYSHRREILRNSIIMMIVSGLLLYLSYRFFSGVKKKATFDSLTKLYNRHAFTETIASKIENGVVLMIDIDDFKKVNDENGHLFGDQVLGIVADEISTHIREKDYAVRWGGEEFAVFLVDTTLDVGTMRAEDIRVSIAMRDIESKYVTVSVGVSELSGDYHVSMIHADEALYFAKNKGKNRISIYDEDEMEK